MNILAYIETADGKLKKSALEILSYGAAIASQTGGQLTAIAIGDVQADELAKAGRYGAAKVLHANNDKLKQYVGQAYATAVAEAAKNIQADVVGTFQLIFRKRNGSAYCSKTKCCNG